MDQQLTANKSALLDGYVSPLQPIDEALSRIFPTSQEESRLQKARRIMGDELVRVSDEDLEIYLTELQFLIDTWLDTFERQVYSGKTLKELIQE